MEKFKYKMVEPRDRMIIALTVSNELYTRIKQAAESAVGQQGRASQYSKRKNKNGTMQELIRQMCAHCLKDMGF